MMKAKLPRTSFGRIILIFIHQQSTLHQIRAAPVQEIPRLAIDELAKLAVIIGEWCCPGERVPGICLFDETVYLL